MMRAWILLLAVLVFAGDASAQSRPLAIVDARIVPAPDAEPIARGVVLVRDGRIEAVGPGGEVALPADAEIVDARGGTVVAGFWNSHVHLLAPPFDRVRAQPAAALSEALADSYLRWGFTTIFDLSSAPGNGIALRRRIDAGDVAGPMVLTTDAPFFPKDGTPAYVSDEEGGGWSFRQAEVSTPAEASARARRQLRDGADALKIFAGAIVGGEVGVRVMDPAVASAVVDAAHAAGKPVFAHPSNLAGLQLALDSGVDVLAHVAPMAGDWPDALLQRLVAADVALVPSLKLFEIELRKEGAPAEAFAPVMAAAKRQLGAYAAAGGQILFGTDAGYVDWYDTRDELRLMHEAGLDWRQLLASLTTTPAARFGHGERKGKVMAGMDADLVILGGDPATDIAAFSDVRHTLRAGRIVHRAEAARDAD